MVAADRAEARGDVHAALRVIRETQLSEDEKPFWRPPRVHRLLQIEELGISLPRWATSRWILEQALQLLDDPNRGRSSEALRIAIGARGGIDVLPGTDEMDARCKVMDHDWLHRQLFLYDLGGLRHFLQTAAAPELIAAADRIREWPDAEMRGYRLVRQTPQLITWQDLASGEEVEVLNLGAAIVRDRGDCVIGRVVPTILDRMFETAPLPVPERVATDVSRDPAGWVATLLTACQEYDVAPCVGGEVDAAIVLSGPFDYGLVTDVPRAYRRAMAEGYAGEIGGDPRAEGEDGLVVDAVRLARAGLACPGVAPDALAVRMYPAIAAALVEPGVSRSLRRFVSLELALRWRALASVLPEPAADLCHELAQESWGAA